MRDVSSLGLGRAVDDVRGGVSRIRAIHARASSDVTVEIDVGGDEPEWRYLLTFNQDNRRVPVVKKEMVTDLVNGRTLVDRPTADDAADPERMTQTYGEQIAQNREFRPVVDMLKSISYQHVVPQAVRDPRGFSPAPVSNDPWGRDLLQRIWTTPERTRTARLSRIAGVLEAVMPSLEKLDIERDPDGGTAHLIARYRNWRPHAAKQDESQLSDGTLRLFGLMWSVFDDGGPLLLEEPELSLHPALVRQLPELFETLQKEIVKMRRSRSARRQLIISTHSDEMLDDPSIDADEMVRIQIADEGSTIETATEHERRQLDAGLTAADVFLTADERPQLSLFGAFGA